MVTLIMVYVFKTHGYLTYYVCAICGYFRYDTSTCMVT